jgi:hypothetical protein
MMRVVGWRVFECDTTLKCVHLDATISNIKSNTCICELCDKARDHTRARDSAKTEACCTVDKATVWKVKYNGNITLKFKQKNTTHFVHGVRLFIDTSELSNSLTNFFIIFVDLIRKVFLWNQWTKLTGVREHKSGINLWHSWNGEMKHEQKIIGLLDFLNIYMLTNFSYPSCGFKLN